MNKKVLLVVTAIVVIAGNVWAADPNWTGANNSSWTNALNWSPSVPTSISKATVNLRGTYAPTISTIVDVNQLFVAESAGAFPGAQTVTVATGGKLKANQEIVLGYGDTDDGKILVTGTGDVNSNHLFLGFKPGSKGRLQIDGGKVTVRQMFGLSWEGGDGYVQLNSGGTLQTEQFAFEANDISGTAAMNIATGGKWIQNYFWYNEIKSLVWNGKITGNGSRSNAVVTWKPAGIGHTEVTAVASLTEPNFIVVKQDGSGDYTTIQDALDATVKGSVVEVRDNGVYTENLKFKDSNSLVDANYVTLQSGTGFRPTITLSGSVRDTNYIDILAVGTTLQGFNINFSGSVYTPPTGGDSNSVLIHGKGGASTVRDCDIVGPAGYIRGIVGIANIEDVNLSNCRIGILCDANLPNNGFAYSITDSHIYNCRQRGILFSNSTATMDKTTVELCGTAGETSPDFPGGNILINGGATGVGGVNLLIKNSIIRKAIMGRNINMEAAGRVDVNDSIIMDALGDKTHSDEILQYRGTLNLNRCIVKIGQRIGVNMTANPPGGDTVICNIDHCDFYDPNMAVTLNGQWAITTMDPCAVLTIKNSILTGDNGFLRNMGAFTSNWNDNFCGNRGYIRGVTGTVVLGLNDINLPGGVGVNPQYIQTVNPDEPNFFKLQPYSPLVHADEDGEYMGSQGVLAGQEAYPPDFDKDIDVDFIDFAKFALKWRTPLNGFIPAIPQSMQDNFESYSGTGTLPTPAVGTLLGPRVSGGERVWRDIPQSWQTDDPDYYNVGWYCGKSTLTLLTTDANSGTKSMQWAYDVNDESWMPDVNQVRYAEILVMLPAPINLTPYNELRVSLKRLSGNTPDTETALYARFIDLNACDHPHLVAQPFGIVGEVMGGQTAAPVGVWYDWTINFDNYVPSTVYGTPKGNRTNIGAIIFGVKTQPNKPYSDGEGTIYVDTIRLVDRPGCTPIVEDINKDCRLDFRDVEQFVDYWLLGTNN